MSALVQTVAVGVAINVVARGLDEAAANALLGNLAGTMAAAFGVTLAIMLPLTYLVGLSFTHKFAGPIFRFESHLRAIVRGEEPGSCRIRDGDQLQEFCAVMNEAIETSREEGARRAAEQRQAA